MNHALALLLIVSAGAVPAGKAVPRIEGAVEGRVTRLATANDLAELCRALEPSERLRAAGDAVERGEAAARHDAARDDVAKGRYEVLVPAARLAFEAYDAGERRLALADAALIPAGEGRARLWPALERGLPVDVDAQGARAVLAAQRSRTLALSLVFDLADDVTCGPAANGKAATLAIEPVAWRWLTGAKVLARGGAEAGRPTATVAEGAKPRVEIGMPVSGPREARGLVASRKRDLEECYADALRGAPALDGVVVAEVGGGHAIVVGDSAGEGALAMCVQHALAHVASGGPRAAVPIRFELVPPAAN